MDTKLTGDIAVQYAVLEGLKRNWGVMLPVGDRLPYDLVFDVQGVLHRIQVKSAYQMGVVYAANTRRAKTNRANYKFERYSEGDFDFAMLWHPAELAFYILPISVFLTFKSKVSLPAPGRSRNSANRAADYKEAWDQFSALSSKG